VILGLHALAIDTFIFLPLANQTVSLSLLSNNQLYLLKIKLPLEVSFSFYLHIRLSFHSTSSLFDQRDPQTLFFELQYLVFIMPTRFFFSQKQLIQSLEAHCYHHR
jgi:hypothetical protein